MADSISPITSLVENGAFPCDSFRNLGGNFHHYWNQCRAGSTLAQWSSSRILSAVLRGSIFAFAKSEFCSKTATRLTDSKKIRDKAGSE